MLHSGVMYSMHLFIEHMFSFNTHGGLIKDDSLSIYSFMKKKTTFGPFQ